MRAPLSRTSPWFFVALFPVACALHITSQQSLQLAPDSTTFEESLPTIRTVGLVKLNAFAPSITVTEEPAPIVQAVNPDEGPIYGNVAIDIIGSGFGKMDLGQVASIGGCPCLSTTYISDTKLRCVIPPGMGADKSVCVSVLGVESTVDCSFTYRDEGPFVQQVVPAQGPTHGETEVTIYGVNLGAPELDPKPYIGGFPCLSSKWISSREITCVVPPGTGTKLNVTVIIAGLRAGSTAKFSYMAPQVHQIKPCKGPTYGLVTMTILGQGLGSPLTEPVVTVGGMPCTDLKVLSPSKLCCLVPPGSPGASKVQVTLGGRSVVGVPDFIYLPPVIESIHPADASLWGTVALTINGRNFGSRDCGECEEPRVTLGDFLCPNSTLVSPTEITCLVPPAIKPGHVHVKVQVNDYSSDTCEKTHCSNMFEYKAPVVKAISPVRGATYGGYDITVSGEYFGPEQLDQIVYVGDLPCLDDGGGRWESPTEMVCAVPPGPAGEAKIRISSSHTPPPECMEEPTEEDPSPCKRGSMFTYEGPHVVRMTPSRGPTIGGTKILVSGRNLGGMTNEPATFQEIKDMTCGGESFNLEDGTANPWKGGVEACQTKCGESRACMAFEFSKDSECDWKSAMDADEKLTPTPGGSCYRKKSNAVPIIYLDGSRCLKVEQISETQLKCVTPRGPPGEAEVVVNVRGERSDAGPGGGCPAVGSSPSNTIPALCGQSFLYEGPAVSSVTPCSGSYEGGYKVTILGREFGGKTDRRKVMVGNHPCLKNAWVSPKELTCLMPAGPSGPVDVTVSVAGAPAGEAVQFNYEPPVVDRVAPSLGGLAGGTTIAIFGSGFGTSGAAGKLAVTVDGESCRPALRVSDFEIQCTTPPGLRSAVVSVMVSVGPESSAEPAVHCSAKKGPVPSTCPVFQYEPPVLRTVTPPSGPVYGGQRLTVHGEAMGSSQGKLLPKVFFDLIYACTDVEVLSDRELTCTSPDVPMAGTMTMTLHVAGSTSNPLTGYVFENPSIYRITPPSMTTAGGLRVTITGRHFGTKVPVVHIGKVPCLEVEPDKRSPESRLTCVPPQHLAGHIPVSMTVNNHPSPGAPGSFTKAIKGAKESLPVLIYEPPLVSSVTPVAGPWTGGTLVHIFGSGFGLTVADLRVMIGGAACQKLVRKTDKLLECVTMPAPPGARDIQVLVAGISTELPDDDTAKLLEACKGIKAGCGGPKPVQFQFLPPHLDLITPAEAPVFGGTVLRIYARNIKGPTSDPVETGPDTAFPDGWGGVGEMTSSQIQVFVGDQACLRTTVLSDTMIECVAPPQLEGCGDHVKVTVALGLVKSDDTLELAYVPPSIGHLLPSTGPIDGGQTIDVFGNFLGREALKDGSVGALRPHILVGGQPCISTVFVSPFRAKCVVPPLAAPEEGEELDCCDHVVEVTAEIDNADKTMAKVSAAVSSSHYVYKRPSVISSTLTSCEWYGGCDFNVTGKNLEAWQKSTTVTIGVDGVPCRRSVIFSATLASCEGSPPTQKAGGKDSVVTVQVEEANGAKYKYDSKCPFTCDLPKIVGVKKGEVSKGPSSGPAYGGTRVTLQGHLLMPPTSGPGMGRYMKPVVLFGDVGGFDVEVKRGEKAGDLQTILVTSPPSTMGAMEVEMSALLPVVGGPTQELNASCFQFCGPVVTSASPSQVPLYAGTTLTVRGTCLGDPGRPVRTTVTVGGVLCANPVTKSSEELTCTIPIGSAPSTVTVGVLVGGAVGARTSTAAAPTLEYIAPAMTKVSPAVVPVYGGTTLTITGVNMGNDKHKPVVTVGGAMCGNVVVTKEGTELTCTSPPAAAGPQAVELELLGSRGGCAKCVTFQAPQVTSVNPPSGPMGGGSTLQVNGVFLGAEGMRTEVHIGGVPCQKTLWLSSKMLRCEGTPATAVCSDCNSSVTVAVEGVGANGNASSVVFGYSSAANVYSYKLPVIESISPLSGPVFGRTVLTIKASNVGADGHVSPLIGGAPCLEYKRVSKSEFTCTTPPLTSNKGGSAKVTLSLLGGNEGPPAPNHFKYEPIVLSPLINASGPVYGGTTLTLEGNFGALTALLNAGGDDAKALSPLVTVGGVPCLATRPVAGRTDALECGLPPSCGVCAAPVSRVPVRLSIAGIHTDPLYFHYQQPEVSALQPKVMPTYGGRLTITGKQFGVEQKIEPVVFVGETLCQDTKLISPVEIQCTVPPAEAADAVSVVVHVASYCSKAHEAANFAYQPPAVVKVEPKAGPSCGHTNITITGKRFGAEKGSAAVLVGGRPCKMLEERRAGAGDIDDVLVCEVPPAIAQNHMHIKEFAVNILVSVGAQASLLSKGYIYNALRVVSVSPSEGILAGVEVEVRGTGFPLVPKDAPAEKQLSLTFGNTNCGAVKRVNSTLLRCTLPNGTGSPVVHAHAWGQHSSPLKSGFQYMPPTVTAVNPDTCGVKGGCIITVTGKSFGPAIGAADVIVGGQPCQKVEHVSISELRCTVTPGIGADLTVEVDVGGQNSGPKKTAPSSTTMSLGLADAPATDASDFIFKATKAVTFSFKTPVVTAVQLVSTGVQILPAKGGVPVTVVGTDLCLPFKVFTSGEMAAAKEEARILAARETLAAKTMASFRGWEKASVALGRELAKAARAFEVELTARADKERAATKEANKVVAEEALESQYKQLAGIVSDIKEKHEKRAAAASTAGAARREDLEKKVKALRGAAQKRVDTLAEDRHRAAAQRRSKATQMQGTLYAQAEAGRRALHKAAAVAQQLREEQHAKTKEDVVAQVARLTKLAEQLELHTAKLREQRAPDTAAKTASLLELEALEDPFHQASPYRSPCGGSAAADGCVEMETIDTVALTTDDGAAPVDGVAPPTTSTSLEHVEDSHVEIEDSQPEVLDPTKGATVTIGGRPCIEPSCVSDMAVRCILPPGIGKGRQVVLTYGGVSSPAAAVVDYAPPSVDHVEPSLGPTAGGMELTVVGKNFGVMMEGAESLKVTVGGSLCANPKRTQNDTDIVCTLPSGTGASKVVKVTVAGQSTDSYSDFSYIRPSIESIVPQDLATVGGSTITIKGTNLGPEAIPGAPSPKLPEDISVKVGDSECANVRILSSSKILCEVPAGIGRSVPVTASIDGLTTRQPSLFNYHAPEVTRVQPSHAPVAGGALVTIHGVHFGATAPADPIIATFAGLRANKACKWLSDATAECTVPSGISAFVPVVLLVEKQLSTTNTKLFSYDPPHVDKVEPQHAPEGSVLTVEGLNFGKTAKQAEGASVSLGVTRCLKTTWVSDTRLTCVVPPGVGAGRKVTVTVARQKSNLDATFDFELPSVSSVVPSHGAAAGGELLQINGRGFGPHPSNRASEWEVEAARFRFKEVAVASPLPARAWAEPLSGVTVTIGDAECTSPEWLSPHAITCIAPVGVGADRKLRVVVAGQKQAVKEGAPAPQFSYDAPQVTAVVTEVEEEAEEEDLGDSTVATTGGGRIGVHGKNFGPAGGEDQGLVSIYIGEDACTELKVLSDSLMTCAAPAGVGKNLDVTVRVAAQVSKPKTGFAFAKPTVTEVKPARAPAGAEVTIVGTGFGTEDSVPVVDVGGRPCDATSWIKDSQVLCKVPVGVGVDRPVTVAVAGQSSLAMNLFSYAAPTFSAVEPMVAPIAGGGLLTLTGGNFGSAANRQLVLVGGKPCSDTVWKSPEKLVCTSPPLLGAVGIQVVIGGQSATLPFKVTAEAPTVESILPIGGPCEGGMRLHIAAKNIPGLPVPMGVNIKVMVGANPCTSVTVVEDGVTCKVPRGGGAANVKLTVAGISSTEPVFFEYDAPVITVTSPMYGVNAGGTVVTVYGKNFGPFNGVSVPGTDGGDPTQVPLELEIGGVPCKKVKRLGEDDPALADSQAVCITMPGDGSCRDVAAVVGTTRRSNPAALFSFRAADAEPFVQEVFASNLEQYVDGSRLSVMCICRELDAKRCIAADLADAFECVAPSLAVATINPLLVAQVRSNFQLTSSTLQEFIVVRKAEGGPPAPETNDRLVWHTDSQSREEYVKEVALWVKQQLT